MRLLVILLASSTLAACSGNQPPPASIYDTCVDVNDCVESATRCEELSVEFGGFVYENAICTTECQTEGPVSRDCSRAYIGRQGSCYPASVAGGFSDTPICFEPCDTDLDCLYGFRCLTAVDLCGTDPTCPIPLTDAICVPGRL
jgi:hypothetical protein